MPLSLIIRRYSSTAAAVAGPSSPTLACPTSSSSTFFNALVRTHHTTSRKKIAKLKDSAAKQHVAVVIKYGKPPGIMYVEGEEGGVREWVGVVQRLRYKDYRLAIKAAAVQREDGIKGVEMDGVLGRLAECESVSDFGVEMQRRGVHAWWRRGMQ